MDSSSPAMQSTNTSSPNITNLSSRPPANTSSPANNNTINLIDNDINMDDDIQTTTSTTSTTSTTNNSTNNNNNNNAKQPSTPSTPTVVPPRRAAPPPLDENADETDDDLLLDEYPSDEDDEIYPEDAKSRRGGGHNQNHQQQTSPQGDKVARQIKRVRKYADEEEEQNQQALGTPNQLGQTPQTPQTPGASGDRPAPNGRGRPKKYVPQDEEDDPNDPNNEKKKKSKKTPPNTLDIRPCWFAGCTKADRSLKILRPCLIPTCKTHAIKSESRIYDALGKGFCLEEQGQKDTVCGICGESNKPLSHCANDECAFGYCPPCTEIIVSKHGNQPGRPGWMCWVCNFVKIRGKERERTRWVREVSQPNSYTPGPRKQRVPKAAPEGNTSGGNEGTPSLTGKRQRKGKQNMAGMEGEYDLAATAAPGGSGTPNNNAAPAPAKRGRKRLYNADQGQADTTSVPASPEQGEIKELTDGAIRDTNNGNRNLPLERAISRVFEHHELSNRIEKECTATRSILVIAIDNAMKAVEEMQARLRLTFDEDTKKEVRISHELVSLEEQLSKTIVDVQRLKNQEDELVEKLSAVRNQLATVDGHREALSKRCSDLKIEALLSKNELAESELNAKVKEATLDNEMNALHSLIGLIEGVFWGHEYFYCTEIGECEKAISEKLASHNEKITFKNDIPLASALKSGIQIQSLKELQPNNNNVLATNTSANGDVSAGGETEGSDDVVSFVNPFKTLCIYHNACMEHNVPDFHLEKPDRIRVAVSTIQEFVNRYPGIVEIFNTPPEIEQRYVMAVHDAHYIRKLETSLPPENSDYETHLESDNTGAAVAVTQKEGEDDEIYDTFLSHRSMKAALRAAGAVCSAVDSVTKRSCRVTTTSSLSRSMCATRSVISTRAPAKTTLRCARTARPRTTSSTSA
ncbi:FYVE-type Zn finger-containing protein [Cavenderia fasciculata]|uniref:FYVE-type Zn finger-containing protein n=1 Tax=Cavenderia fasciculata TaxID=261658 RepID=F4PUI6_CACFS|nr:FYVE-type Zn finger-containing protein [Cavenderia fasciculata]EGG21850.1 FYVE-type Zn finger-containing protein [Cavenderia fasciculata]|eukprot:XP_004359701.1 FYVE-type Zn finger-containing protein [Cavenderia fasciculata]